MYLCICISYIYSARHNLTGRHLTTKQHTQQACQSPTHREACRTISFSAFKLLAWMYSAAALLCLPAFFLRFWRSARHGTPTGLRRLMQHFPQWALAQPLFSDQKGWDTCSYPMTWRGGCMVGGCIVGVAHDQLPHKEPEPQTRAAHVYVSSVCETARKIKSALPRCMSVAPQIFAAAAAWFHWVSLQVKQGKQTARQCTARRGSSLLIGWITKIKPGSMSTNCHDHCV